MIREEEIKQAIKDICSCSYCKLDKDYCHCCKERNVTIEAINWADQHPRKGLWDAEKVCEWLKENCWLYDIVQVYCVQTNIDDIIHDLRKAMED